jgi:hypothetical protein
MKCRTFVIERHTDLLRVCAESRRNASYKDGALVLAPEENAVKNCFPARNDSVMPLQQQSCTDDPSAAILSPVRRFGIGFCWIGCK